MDSVLVWAIIQKVSYSLRPQDSNREATCCLHEYIHIFQTSQENSFKLLLCNRQLKVSHFSTCCTFSYWPSKCTSDWGSVCKKLEKVMQTNVWLTVQADTQKKIITNSFKSKTSIGKDQMKVNVLVKCYFKWKHVHVVKDLKKGGCEGWPNRRWINRDNSTTIRSWESGEQNCPCSLCGRNANSLSSLSILPHLPIVGIYELLYAEKGR